MRNFRKLTRRLPVTFALTGALALSLAACGDSGSSDVSGDPVAEMQAPDGQSWQDIVKKTDEGGFVIGNPAAPIKLVEYASVTCSHCAQFEEEAFPELFEEYVSTGKVSLEIRNFLLNPYDIPITLLTQCSGEDAFLALTKEVFKNQGDILGKLQTADQAVMQAAIDKPEDERFLALAQAMGILDFFAARGVSQDQAKACLTDKAKADALIAQTEKGKNEVGVSGTPFFLINGQKTEFSGWPALESDLQEAGAR